MLDSKSEDALCLELGVATGLKVYIKAVFSFDQSCSHTIKKLLEVSNLTKATLAMREHDQRLLHSTLVGFQSLIVVEAA